jgi:hypothetical protein
MHMVISRSRAAAVWAGFEISFHYHVQAMLELVLCILF